MKTQTYSLVEVFFFFFFHFSFFYSDLRECLSVCLSPCLPCLWRPEEGLRSLGTGVTGSYEHRRLGAGNTVWVPGKSSRALSHRATTSAPEIYSCIQLTHVCVYCMSLYATLVYRSLCRLEEYVRLHGTVVTGYCEVPETEPRLSARMVCTLNH